MGIQKLSVSILLIVVYVGHGTCRHSGGPGAGNWHGPPKPECRQKPEKLPEGLEWVSDFDNADRVMAFDHGVPILFCAHGCCGEFWRPDCCPAPGANSHEEQNLEHHQENHDQWMDGNDDHRGHDDHDDQWGHDNHDRWGHKNDDQGEHGNHDEWEHGNHDQWEHGNQDQPSHGNHDEWEHGKHDQWEHGNHDQPSHGNHDQWKHGNHDHKNHDQLRPGNHEQLGHENHEQWGIENGLGGKEHDDDHHGGHHAHEVIVAVMLSAAALAVIIAVTFCIIRRKKRTGQQMANTISTDSMGPIMDASMFPSGKGKLPVNPESSEVPDPIFVSGVPPPAYDLIKAGGEDDPAPPTYSSLCLQEAAGDSLPSPLDKDKEGSTA